jgi:hypothetical protein
VIQKLLKLLTISMFPLLLASSHLQLTEEDIQNNRDYYEVINAATGEKEERRLYTDNPGIETHLTAVLAIRKALANEGIDPSTVIVLLYYDGLITDDSLSPRMWQRKPHPSTITSPWLDLTKTLTTSGETRITIRIDATGSRLLSDVFSKPEDKSNVSGFLSIPFIKRSCSSKIIAKYQTAKLERLQSLRTPESKSKEWVVNEARKSSNCAPEKLREPLLSLIKSSDQPDTLTDSNMFEYGVFGQLSYRLQDQAKQYYRELYPRLAVRGLQILESESSPEPKWWTEIIDQIQIKPIQEYQR